jgi:hypothetical protein
MSRLQRSRWILWLLMFCIGAQGIGAATHRIGHGGHSSTSVALSSPDSKADVGKLSAQIDEGTAQHTELCLVCASLAAAKHLNFAPFWLPYAAFTAHHADADRRPRLTSKRLLFALARAPPFDLS